MKKPVDPKGQGVEVPGISERDERLLSALCDGELTESDTAQLLARVAADSSLKRHLDVLTLMRENVVSLLTAPAGDDAIRSRDAMWSRIERELRPAVAEQRVARAAGTWWSRVLKGVGFQPIALVGGMAVALLIFNGRSLTGFNGAVSPGVELSGQSNQGAGTLAAAERGDGELPSAADSGREPMVLSEQLIMDPQDQEGVPDAPTLVAFHQPKPDLLARVGIDDIQPVLNIDSDVPEDLVGRLMPPAAVASAGQYDAGYRTGGVDIAWIRSERPVHLVSSRRDSSAPVVWVSRSGSQR